MSAINPDTLKNIPVHFILCTERTGSSLLSLMLNLNPKVICSSEELFALYFYKKYKNKVKWTETELKLYIDEFWLMSEQNLDLNFTTKELFHRSLISFKDNLDYSSLVKLSYLHFLEPKPKDKIEIIIDKQIKYLFHIPLLVKIFPEAKFVILTRDVRDNIVAKSGRKLNLSSNTIFLSSLWHFTYSGVKELMTYKKQLYIIRYENLVSDTRNEISNLCSFLNIPFDEAMLNTSGAYDRFLEARKPFLSGGEFDKIKKFNSELRSEINTKKIGIFKNTLDEKTLGKICFQNKELLNLMGYESKGCDERQLSIIDKWYVFLAYLYRPVLLNYYYKIPLDLKLIIKRMRKS